MKLIIPIAINLLLVLLFNKLLKIDKFYRISKLKKEILIGICFGAASMFASSFGVEVLGIVVNVRDSAPISAGLIFGPIAGIIAGFMGGGYRALSVLWGAGEYTALACTISTIVAGFVAAILRKTMFESKRPSFGYAIGITVVIEVFHMLMIFITNFNDANTAFLFVKQCTLIMVIANSLTVGVSVLLIAIINKEFKFKKRKIEKSLIDIVEMRLLMVIMIAFIITGVFTYNLQTGIANKQTEELFKVAMEDVYLDIKNESDDFLLEIVKDVKEKYLEDENVDLTSLLKTNEYEIKEINIISSNGIIINSSDLDNFNFDMKSYEQSKEFMVLANQSSEKTLVQLYRRNAKGFYRKYAGISLDNGGFIQVGYDSEQFHSKLDTFVIKSTKNRHVGANGFIAVCDEKLKLVTDDKYNELDISNIGIIPNDEMKSYEKANKIYTTNIININNSYKEEYMYVFTFVEGYCIIAATPKSDAMLLNEASMYLNLFMEVLIFAALFVVIYYFIKKKIIKNIHIINNDLSNIVNGDLDVLVNVYVNEEFSKLSNDINSTVSTLKSYIALAEARINQELEYAKQIQLSAMPTNHFENEEFSIYALINAAKEVGGDFYDFYLIDNDNVAFLVADVSGKGIPAAMFMMRAKTIIKDLAESGMEVNEIFNVTNEKLCSNNDSGMFVTAWMGIYNSKTGVLKYANAGHNPPVILNEDNEFEFIKTKPGLVLGGLDGVKYKTYEIDLKKGQRIFLYTDGVTEAINENNELFKEERLLRYLNDNSKNESNMVLSNLKKNIDEFAGDVPQFDDITMLIFSINENYDNIFEKEFDAVDEQLHNVIELFENLLSEYNCNPKEIMSICVAIEEIFVNVAHYAYSDNDGKCKFTVSLNKNSRKMKVVIEDSGTCFNPLLNEEPDVTLKEEERRIGGLGIYIVKKTMDNIFYKYENNKNILTLIKKI